MDTNQSELSRLKDANPVDDANKAIRANDLRFLAVQDYAITVPGIEDYEERFSAKCKYRIIDGTTDAPKDDADFKLQAGAIEYAKSYNQVLRDYLEKQE